MTKHVIGVKTKPYKAYVAFALTVLAAFIVATEGKVHNFNDLTLFQWVMLFIGSIVTAGGVWLKSNPVAKNQDF